MAYRKSLCFWAVLAVQREGDQTKVIFKELRKNMNTSENTSGEIHAYYESLTEIEQTGFRSAAKVLGPHFNVVKSNGFLAWKEAGEGKNKIKEPSIDIESFFSSQAVVFKKPRVVKKPELTVTSFFESKPN